MNRKKSLKYGLVFIYLLIVGLIGYQVYLFIYKRDYQALNIENIERIETRLQGKDRYRFAVVGNISNSMQIFKKRIIPLIKDSSADFMVSVGNSVYDGAEEKYSLLYHGLRKLNIPYVMTVGHNEVEDFGAEKFYHHFGPYFFSFHLKNAYFVFLDATGHTSWKEQLPWLKQELTRAEQYPYRFVFLNCSIFSLPGYNPDNTHYVPKEKLSRDLQQLFSRCQVTAVFSAGYPTYKEYVEKGVHYIVSGGGGGLLLDQREPYQIVNVDVENKKVAFENIVAADRMGKIHEKLEILKLYLYSFFSMNFFNTLLVISILSFMVLKLLSWTFYHKRLYRDFSVDEKEFSQKSLLHVAMFTNNYLPFVGGVPLSIERLYQGLRRLGETVSIFAPSYPKPWTDPEDGSIIRYPGLFGACLAGFPIANVFSRNIKTLYKTVEYDLVHVHHPFWLGKKGMHFAQERDLPVVFSYHTRLERYIHYLPFPGTALKELAAHILIKRFANRCDAIITPTPSTKEYLRNLGVSTLIEIIPTGIDMDDYNCWTTEQINELRNQYVTNEEPLLISVSRMAKEKNLDFLLEGLAKVTEIFSAPFKCLLVGDGPEKKRLKDKSAALGLNDVIVFTGNILPRDVARYYLAADLFVFASTSETQGMVLIEAMAGGCPVVAVRSSGVHDVVKNGYNGFMVPENIESWADAVATLLIDRKKNSTLSENSLLFAKEYSEEKIALKVLNLYRRVIALGKSKVN